MQSKSIFPHQRNQEWSGLGDSVAALPGWVANTMPTGWALTIGAPSHTEEGHYQVASLGTETLGQQAIVQTVPVRGSGSTRFWVMNWRHLLNGTNGAIEDVTDTSLFIGGAQLGVRIKHKGSDGLTYLEWTTASTAWDGAYGGSEQRDELQLLGNIGGNNPNAEKRKCIGIDVRWSRRELDFLVYDPILNKMAVQRTFDLPGLQTNATDALVRGGIHIARSSGALGAGLQMRFGGFGLQSA